MNQIRPAFDRLTHLDEDRIDHSVGQRLDLVLHLHRLEDEEAGAFAAGAEAQLTGRLTACAGTCGPGSLHFINGLYEANRNRAPVILIATQIVRKDLGFQSIQEIDFNDVFKGCSVYCEMIVTPEQARRKTVAACQAALTNAVLRHRLLSALSATSFARMTRDLGEIAAVLSRNEVITIYANASCAGVHDVAVATAA